jgi:hypothetical protein
VLLERPLQQLLLALQHRLGAFLLRSGCAALLLLTHGSAREGEGRHDGVATEVARGLVLTPGQGVPTLLRHAGPQRGRLRFERLEFTHALAPRARLSGLELGQASLSRSATLGIDL